MGFVHSLTTAASSPDCSSQLLYGESDASCPIRGLVSVILPFPRDSRSTCNPRCIRAHFTAGLRSQRIQGHSSDTYRHENPFQLISGPAALMVDGLP